MSENTPLQRVLGADQALSGGAWKSRLGVLDRAAVLQVSRDADRAKRVAAGEGGESGFNRTATVRAGCEGTPQLSSTGGRGAGARARRRVGRQGPAPESARSDPIRSCATGRETRRSRQIDSRGPPPVRCEGWDPLTRVRGSVRTLTRPDPRPRQS